MGCTRHALIVAKTSWKGHSTPGVTGRDTFRQSTHGYAEGKPQPHTLTTLPLQAFHQHSSRIYCRGSLNGQGVCGTQWNTRQQQSGQNSTTPSHGCVTKIKSPACSPTQTQEKDTLCPIDQQRGVTQP